ncbi:pirin family protein [uncultured Brevundimonas sp.]|uniref:pirin family protein n=1 Tax=uncultured Brevundimonas sp. TaxID=213418 RepID=UPI00262ECBA6|nr:pirin family protein [uncultured Brevundimonas sp.]
MIELVIEGTRRDLGGFEVSRILPHVQQRMVGPFVFLDQMGPAEFAPGSDAINVRPHPHIGLSTLTYLFEGEIMHRDSLGYTQPIIPGEVNWMTAGSGIVHSERTDPLKKSQGGAMHGMQAWVALPTEKEEIAPSFTHLGEDAQPSDRSGGVFTRLVAGAAFGERAGTPVESPLYYLHYELPVGGTFTAPPGPGKAGGYSERAIYIAAGEVEVDHQRFHTGQMVVFAPHAEPVITAIQPSTVMSMGGEPLGKRHIWWNFVSSSKERIDQAKADWKAGRMILPPEDSLEFIPLPE